METPHATKNHLLGLALVLLALVPVVLWPGDVSWLIDESRILATAWHANHDGQLADGGLYGNFGIRYGPLPTQIYQLLLLLTHDPIALVVLRGLLCAGGSAAALLWLARTLKLPAWFAAAILISPHVVAFHRILWDASFAMPIGALALAAFADFGKTQRPRSLRLCLVASVLLPLIHPQALALSVPILGWLGWRQRAALWSDRRALAVLGVIVFALHAAYLFQATGQLFARFSGSVEKGYPGGGSRALSALAPLLGGRLLCGADYLESLASPLGPRWPQSLAQWGARFIYPLIWLGIAVSARRVFLGWRAAHKAGPAFIVPVGDAVAAVALGGLLFQALLSGAMRVPALPQYFFGTFALHALLAWIGIAALSRWRIGRMPGVLYAAGGAVLTVTAVLTIHARGFERPRWPTLAHGVAVARELNAFTDTTALTDVALYQKHPQPLRTLRLLLPPAPGAPQRASGRLLITAADSAIADGKVRLFELPPAAAAPPASQPLDLTPLPKNWVPDPATWQPAAAQK